MTQRLTRRQMLKWLALGGAAATLFPVQSTSARARYARDLKSRLDGVVPSQFVHPDPDRRTDMWVWTGRAIHTVAFYEEPSTRAKRLEVRYRDESFRILGQVRAPFSAHNDLWYKTSLGYVHSAWVLPLRIYPPQPFIGDVGPDTVLPWGFWGEVAQIYTEARAQPDYNAARIYRLYGGTVYHVVGAVQDAQGNGWYKIVDDYPPRKQSYQWVPAQDVRRIPHKELAPIHPFAGQKRIEVDLGQQMLMCYEGNQVVFDTQVASGAGANATPRGDYCVLLKQLSRHMSNVPYPEMPTPTPEPDDVFDLPGVPWNTFFALDGSAIHGVYWHNDFGIPRSHGCLNVSIDAARWIYRWTYPISGYEDAYVQSNCRVGTPVLVK